MFINIMSRKRVLFFGSELSNSYEHTIECLCNDVNDIFIEIKDDDSGNSCFICLDYETAIEFSEMLRNEIAKIDE